MRHDNSVADLCLKAYFFLHFSLSGSRGLTHSKAWIYMNQIFFGSLGEESKKHVNL